MMKKSVLGIDLGTSSVKILQLYQDGTIKRAKTSYQEISRDGWWEAVKNALSMLELGQVVGIGLSSQVGTYIVNDSWIDSWNSGNGAEELESLLQQYGQDTFLNEISMPHPRITSYPLPRLSRILKQESRKNDASAQSPKVCQPKDFICEKLTGNLVTDRYSWRGLANLENGQYSKKLLDAIGFPEEKLPKIVGVTQKAGVTRHIMLNEAQSSQRLNIDVPKEPQNLNIDVPKEPQNLNIDVPKEPQNSNIDVPKEPQNLNIDVPKEPQNSNIDVPKEPQNSNIDVPKEPQNSNIEAQNKPQIPNSEPQYLPAGIPVFTGMNDFFSALLGMGICQTGDLFDISGTSEHIGVVEEKVQLHTEMVSGPYLRKNVHYGVTASSGVSLAFGMELLEEESLKLEDMQGKRPPIFLPYLNGERAPIWDSEARGMFFGLEAGCTKKELAYAVLEGVAFSLYHIYEKLGKPDAKRICLSGGAAVNPLLNRLKAELFELPVEIQAEKDSSALGAAMTAGIGLGWFADYEDAAAKVCRTAERVEPTGSCRSWLMSRYEIYKELYPAVKSQCRKFAELPILQLKNAEQYKSNVNLQNIE